jgi:hypothetical protein
MTVLFRLTNLNMAACLFGLFLGPKSLICSGVVAMQQPIA